MERDFYAVGAARVRETPDPRAKQVAVLKDGQKVTVLGKVKDQDWYLIEQGGKPAGYVAKTLLEDEAAFREREKKRKDQEAAQQAQQTAAVAAPPPSRDPLARPVQPAVGTYDLQPGLVFRDCPDCPDMVVIPAGSFVMGSPAYEQGRDNDEGPQHNVNVRSFMLGKYEVTVGEFARFVNETGHRTDGGCYVWSGAKWDIDQSKNWRNPGFGQGDRHPVACVRWDDAKAYTAWLSRKTGKSYRLATEAEWEYAARAGTSTARYWGNDGNQGCGYANVADQTAKGQVPGASNSETANCNDGHAYTAPVGSFRTNAFGLHDMIGNVWEWTEDCWNDNFSGAPTDGSSWQAGDCKIRVLRGGSWYSIPGLARSAGRLRGIAYIRFSFNGFRVARTN